MTATPATGRGVKGSALPAPDLSKSARRWAAILANPLLHARVNVQRRVAHSERRSRSGQILHARALARRQGRERRRRVARACEGCGEAMPLRFIGQRLSNRTFCDSCLCEREKARRDRLHRERYVPRRRSA